LQPVLPPELTGLPASGGLCSWAVVQLGSYAACPPLAGCAVVQLCSCAVVQLGSYAVMQLGSCAACPPLAGCAVVQLARLWRVVQLCSCAVMGYGFSDTLLNLLYRS